MRHVLCILQGLLLLFLGSCTLSPPSSEALIFQEEKHSNGTLFNQLNNSYTASEPGSNATRFVVSTTASFRGRGEHDYATHRFSSYIAEKLADNEHLTDDDVVIRNPNYLSLAYPITILNRPNIRWAFNVGLPVLGTDVTTPIANQTYLTANLGFGDGELIIQQKLIQTAISGLAAGGYYRAERRGLEVSGDQQSLVPFVPLNDVLNADRIFYNHIIGARLNGFLSTNKDGSFLHLRIAPGFSLNYGEPVVNFGLSIGFK